MLKIQPKFDLQRDVVSDIFKREASFGRPKEYSGAVDTRILNIERDGGILYCWEGATGTTRIGKFDPNTKQNKLLYTFDKQVCVSSCSVNQEETLLAVSLAQWNRGEEHLKPDPSINNTKVLKAVDCRVRVQFLYPDSDRGSVLESHLLLLTEDGYVDQYHVLLSRQEGYRVVIVYPERLSRTADRVAEDFSWVQWDKHSQRLYYLTHRDKSLLRCVQFYPNRNCETVFELVLELPSNPFTSVRFVNLGFDHHHEERPEQERCRMEVFTNRIGSMCVCYSQPVHDNQEITYTMVLVHKGCSKTYKVALDSSNSSSQTDAQLHPLFIPIGYYILVYLSGHFLHCLNSRQQELLCFSLFFSGPDVDLGLPAQSAGIVVLGVEEEPSVSLLDLGSGRIYTADLSSAYLLQILRQDTPTSCGCRHMDTPPSPPDTPTEHGGGPSQGSRSHADAHIWSHHCTSRKSDAQRLAALHCLLVYMGNDPDLQLKIIDWLCDSVITFESFDQIQEFILASLYRISYEKSLGLDKILPYSSVFDKKEVPVCLVEIPAVCCTSELHTEPAFRGKVRGQQGFWEELQWNTEKMRYLEAVPNPRYTPSHTQADWDKLRSERRRSSNHLRHLEENTRKVLSAVDTWSLDKKLVPLFQEVDHQQRALIGLMVDKLREHLNRHLPRLGKKKLDALVTSYVAKLVAGAHKTDIGDRVGLNTNWALVYYALRSRAGPSEWEVFHIMCRILEAMRGLCLPLPPGYHTVLSVLGVRCLPHHIFLQYVDHGLLQLTDTFVSRLMTDLDNSEVNERLKFSILKRLPEPMEQRICQLWDHPISSACISRDYVRTLLAKHRKSKASRFTCRDTPGFRPEFLPLTYLTKILSDMEEQVSNPFEEQGNVDARFVEETALKQTFILLGMEDK